MTRNSGAYALENHVTNGKETPVCLVSRERRGGSVSHENKSANLPAGALTGLVEALEKGLGAGIVAKDRFAPVPSSQDGIGGTGILDALLTGHAVTEKVPIFCQQSTTGTWRSHGAIDRESLH